MAWAKLWGCPGCPGPGAATAADPQRPQGGACARLFHRRRLKWAERRLLVCIESLWYGSIFIQIFVVGSERHVCNATERIIAVQGQFRVIQGR